MYWYLTFYIFYRQSTLHVIELNSSVLNRDVTIHLKHLKEGENSENVVTEQNLTLVLKCHVPVDWIIESSGIIGSLHVVVSKLLIDLTIVQGNNKIVKCWKPTIICLYSILNLFIFLFIKINLHIQLFRSWCFLIN